MATSPAEAVPPALTAERLWNLPNTITILRTAAVPVLLVLPWVQDSRLGSQVLAWLFIVAALTDLVDGWLARRGQMVTRFGKLLDPLADKLLVATALVVLLEADRIPSWGAPMVIVIIGRELAVSALRGLSTTEGRIMAAVWAGKLKALLQNIAIAALLFPTPQWGLPAHSIGLAFLVAATALTLWSGYGYFANFFAQHGSNGSNEERA